jgi:hypothetical protein
MGDREGTGAGCACIGAVGGRGAGGAGGGRRAAAEGGLGDEPFSRGADGSWRGGDGCTVVADASAARGAPQNLQKAAPASATPRHRAHTRGSWASFCVGLVPRSTTRIGAIAGTTGAWCAWCAGAGSGVTGTPGSAFGAAGAGAGPASSVLPHDVQ